MCLFFSYPSPTVSFSLVTDSGGHMRCHPEGLQRAHLQLRFPQWWVPQRWRKRRCWGPGQQRGVQVDHPSRSGRHYFSSVYWISNGGEVRLSGNRRIWTADHLVSWPAWRNEGGKCWYFIKWAFSFFILRVAPWQVVCTVCLVLTKCLWFVRDKIVLVALDVGFPQVLRCVIYFLEHVIFLQRRNRL